MKNFYFAAGLVAASYGLNLRLEDNEYDSYMDFMINENSFILETTLSEFLESREHYDTKFILEADGDDYASCAGNYYHYDVTLNGHPVYFSEEQ